MKTIAKFFMLIIIVMNWQAVYGQLISLPGQTVGSMAPIQITYNGATGSPGSWIGLFPVAEPDGNYATYQGIEASTEGSLTFQGDWQSGYYNFRMFDGSGYTRIATSEPFFIKPGMLINESFQNDGIYRIDALNNQFSDFALDIEIAPDGKIVVFGKAHTGEYYNEYFEIYDIVLLRFDESGVLDESFGSGGIITHSIQNLISVNSGCLAIQPDGKILVGGSIAEPGGICYDHRNFIILRININGTLDSNFGVDGKVVTGFTSDGEPAGYSSDYLSCISLQPDGKILAAGTGYLCNSEVWSRCNLVRYLSDGSLDDEFANNGKRTFTYIGSYESVAAITKPVQNGDGSFFVASVYGNNVLLANRHFVYKFNSNGTLNESFGDLGVINDDRPGLSNSQYIRSLGIGPDNFLYVMGCTGSVGNIWLMKKDPVTGASIGSFGNDGLVIHDFGLGCVPGGMTFNDNKIYVSHSTNYYFWSVSRFNPDGAQDLDFGIPMYQTNEEGVECIVNDLTVDSEGKVIMAGSSLLSGNTEWDFTLFSFAENEEQYQQKQQVVMLNQGWNGLSTFISPSYIDLNDFTSPINTSLIILQNQEGIYQPDNPDNSIVWWDFNKGYFIKVNEPVEFTFPGVPLPQKSVYLSEGWNLIPVLSDLPVPVENLFIDELNSLIILQEAAGYKIFWPEMNINTIGDLIPGKSYLVKLNQAATLTFE